MAPNTVPFITDRFRRTLSRATLLAITLAFPSGLRSEVTSETPLSARPRLTIDRLYSLPSLIGTEPRGFAWSPDGRRLAFLWNDRGFNFRDVWTIDVDDPELEPRRMTSMPRPQDTPGADVEDPVAQARAAEAQERDPGVTAVTWHPDGRHLLATFRGDLWLVDRGSEVRQLISTDVAEQQAAYSPNGSSLTFLRDGELWSMPTNTDQASASTQRTRLAEPDVSITDYRWSPDGLKIAVQQTDQTRVAMRGIPDYLLEETALVQVRRAYPGEEPTRDRIGVLDASAVEASENRVAWLDWRGDTPDMILSFHWSPDGKYLAIDTSDLYAKDRRIYVATVDGDSPPVPRLVTADQDPENETYYFWRIAWSNDSALLYFLSDREEDYHVWAVDPVGGGEPRRLTRGTWAVAEIHPVDGGLIVVGNRGRAEERHLFRVDRNGGEATQISQRPGTHQPTVSPDGRYAAVHFSSQRVPPELLLTSLVAPAGTEARPHLPPRPAPRHGRYGSIIGTEKSPPGERRVTHSPIDEFHEYQWVEAEFVTFESHIDGSTLHGRLTLPPDFDPSRSYPAILGSVYTDSVRNQWGGRTAHPTWGLDQYLAQEGYVLLNVDMRGSWGRGREHRRGIRLDYGGMDIEDLESGVRYLGTLGYVDMERVGIWGSSYGGLMTAMSLFRKPGLYAAGIAGAPATNIWHALTGQMAVMMRPQDQPGEYADSSPFMHAQGLEDPLMIIHGMRDRVVLFKDSVTLVQRLVELGKDVDLVVLPNAGHGWDNEGLAQTRFAFHKMVDFFDRHLKNPTEE